MDVDNITSELKEIQNEIKNLKIERMVVAGCMGLCSIETIHRSLDLIYNPSIYRVSALAISIILVSIYDLHIDIDRRQLQELKEEIELIKEENQKKLIMKNS